LRRWRRELERPSPAEAPCGGVDGPSPITGAEPGSGPGAGRESEAVVVPVDPRDNTTCGEGRAAASFARGVVKEGPGECRCG
jgi:hypothetical protein